MTTTLIIPGLHSSGPDHWQTWFEEQLPGTVRVIQRDWSQPDLPEWSSRVRRDLVRNPGRHLIVAHSFGVLAGVHAAAGHADRIEGALLVAPADPGKFGIEPLMLEGPLPFPAVVVASSNDPWMTLWRAAEFADRLGADLVNLGEAGLINAESGFGAWPEGLVLLERLRRRALSLPAARAIATNTERGRPAAWKSDRASPPGGGAARRSLPALSRLGVG